MAKILPFRPQKDTETIQAEKLVALADELDAVILRHLEAEDLDPRDLVGVLSHRLGTLMRNLEEKNALWGVCEQVLKKQAKID